ncbi:3'-5' exonuclease [Konateibacter massiliensis]|uniref:3'-5' exonuclease n=1 Tax=Konateibacter massiliensis TaxID=2002841 RepID=UPI000C157B56|nr:3'-5' exonuclease [Konateibacter massiliensis]
MNYIVLDLEWNQCPDGKEKENKELPFEIIEIGAVKLDDNYKKISEFSELIKPSVYKEIHYKTKEVIHLDITKLREGRSFLEVCQSFFDWCGEDYLFATWGNMDLTELQRNMKYYRMKHKFEYPLEYCDVQKLYGLYFEKSKERRTLEYAVEQLNIERKKEFHKALFDAEYTGKILSLISQNFVMKNKSIDYYTPPANREEEVYLKYENYNKYVSREFPSKEEAMLDREVISTRCKYCNKNLKRKIRWFSINSRIYYALGYCAEHGYMKCKIRMKKSEKEKYFVVKTIKHISEEESFLIGDKRDELRVKRRVKRKLKKENTI